MACQIKELAEYILANHDETSSVWKQVNAVINADKNIVINSSQVEFNKLPNYKEGQKTMTYAGVGSRETPKEVLELMTKAAAWLEGKGYKLQTGKTFYNKEEGADKAFSDGTKNKELFGPEDATEITKTVAKELHPAPQYLKDGGLKLMARNTNQVFGKNLDTPVDFVLFYAEETNNPLRPKGGTGQAVEMARRKGIPTINMADADWRAQLTTAIKKGKTTPENEEANVETKADAEFGSNSKIKDTVYHYAQSGTIDPTLKTNSKEKALFFFKNRKSAELLQEALNQGKLDKTGKIFEAKINLVNPREVDATDHDTGRLINETIEADKSGNDGIIAHNMTEFFVGADDQYGVFDIEKNVQFLNLGEKQTNSTKNNIKELGKKLNYKDIEQLLETYGNVREIVIGDEVGYVGEHDTKFKINYQQKIRTMDGEVWGAIGLNGRDIAVLKNAITQLNKYRVHSQLTKPQQRVLKVMTDLTHEQLAEIIENSEYAAGASLGYSNIQNQKVGSETNVEFDIIQPSEVFTKNINKMMKKARSKIC